MPRDLVHQATLDVPVVQKKHGELPWFHPHVEDVGMLVNAVEECVIDRRVPLECVLADCAREGGPRVCLEVVR